jgi:hypothetical protein
MGLKATKQASNFEMTPAGAQVARCYRVIDLGTQTTEWQGQQKKAHKVMLSWELLGDERMADGRPFSISKRYTVSTHEKSNMRKDFEAWRGRAFTPAEESTFEIRNVVGAYCLLNVTHNIGGDGNTYANVTSIMPVPKGLPKPAAVNANQVFDIDEPDMEMYESFSDKLKLTIASADEWNKPKSVKGVDDFANDIPWRDEIEVTDDEPVPF